MHLTTATYLALLDQTLPAAEARALAAHLDAGCEACEGWLADRTGADRLDGRVDAALAALSTATAGAGHDLEYARLTRALADGSGAAPPRRRWVLGLAVAAAVLVAGVAGLVQRSPAPAPAPDGWDGIKGAAAQVVPLRLRFLVLLPRAGAVPGIEKGVSGQVVPPEASLQFQVELGREADVVLARATGATAEPFFHARLPAGRTVVSVSGQPAAYPLAQLAGPQRFLALAGAQPVEPADVDRAARGAAAAAGPGQPISLDVIEVHVR
jgi:hypothetical protein